MKKNVQIPIPHWNSIWHSFQNENLLVWHVVTQASEPLEKRISFFTRLRCDAQLFEQDVLFSKKHKSVAEY